MIFIFPLLLAMGGMTSLTLSLFSIQKEDRERNYIYSFHKYAVAFTVIDLFFLNIIFLIGKVYLHGSYFLWLNIVLFLVDIAITFLVLLFREVLALMAGCLPYGEWETVFRLHYRVYTIKYSSLTCERNAEWA